jgi:hypothetical protein
MPPRPVYPQGLDATPLPLLYRGGLVGSPIPRNLTKDGGSIFNNACLGPSPRTLRTAPGWERLMLTRGRVTSTYALDNTKKWVAFDAEPYGVHGTGFALYDWTNTSPTAPILSMGTNPTIPPSFVGGGWDPSTTEFFVLSEYNNQGVDIGRMTPWEFPSSPITFRDRTYFYDPYTQPCTLTSGAFRNSIPNAPQRKPLLWAAASSHDCDVIHESATQFTAVSGNATVPAVANAAPRWSVYSTAPYNYNEITVATSEDSANLCYAERFFSFVDIESEDIKAPQCDDNNAGWGVERGSVAYRVCYCVTCYAPFEMTTGSGLDDIYFTGSSNLNITGDVGDSTHVQVRIATAGAPDTWEYRLSNAGAWTAGGNVNDEVYQQIGTSGIRVRWGATTGHTALDAWTTESEYLGLTDPGFPTRVAEVGDPTDQTSPMDSEVDVEEIPTGSDIIGVGGRKIFRTPSGPLDYLKPSTNIFKDDGRVATGKYKWVYSYVFPELGETPTNIVWDTPEEIPNYPGSFRLTNLAVAGTRCKGYSSGTTPFEPQDAKNDIVLRNHWEDGDGSPDEDWEIVITIASEGSPDTYTWTLNGVTAIAVPLNVTGGWVSLVTDGGFDTGIDVQWSTAPFDNHTTGNNWVLNRSMNNVTRRIYRASDEDEFATFYFVGDQNNLETVFIDNVPKEELGDPWPSLQSLPYYHVKTQLVTDADSFTDQTRDHNMGDKLSKIPDAVNHTRVRFPFRLVDNDDDPGRILSPNSISFFVSASQVPSDEVKEVPIDVPIQAGPWYYLDLPWTYGSYEAYSYGFRQIQRDRDNSVTSFPVFQVGPISIDRGKWGPFVGKWAARFTYTSEELKTETDSSLPSVPVNLDDKATGLELNLPGYRGFWDTLANNFASDPVGINTPPLNNNPTPSATSITHPQINIYLSKESWGSAPDGGGLFTRAVENAQNPVVYNATPDLWDATPIQIGNKDSKFLGEDNSYSIGPSSPGETVEEDKATSQFLTRRTAKKYDAESLTTEGGVLGRTREDTAAIAVEELRQATPLHDYRAPGPATFCAILDQDRIVSGPESDFKVTGTTFTFTKYRDVAKFNPSTSNAKLYPWMEGRTFYIDSNDTDYGGGGQFTTRQRPFVIRKVINPDTPNNTWIVLGSAFSAETLEFKEAYYGSTGDKSYNILGNKSSFRYSTNTNVLGPDPDYWANQNVVTIPFVNDEYQTPAHAGEYLILLGKEQVFRTLIDRTVTDEQGPIAYPKPELIHGMPGTIAPRSVVSLPDGRIAWWTPDNRLALGNAGGFSYFEGNDPDRPMSERYKGWLQTNCDPEYIQFAHAYFDRERDWYVIHFVADGAGSCPEQGTVYNTTAPTATFKYKLTIDLRNKMCWTSDNSPMVCSYRLGADCVDSGQSPGRLLVGDRYGYIYNYGAWDMATAGNPSNQATIAYTVTSTASAGQVINVTPSTLYTTNDGIDNLPVLIETSTGVEAAVIASNTSSQITLIAAPTTVPVAGDIVYVGGIESSVRFREFHFVSHSLLEGVSLDTNNTNITWTFNTYRATSNNIFSSTNTLASTAEIDVSDLRQGWGRKPLRRISSKALLPEIKWIQTDGDICEINSITGYLRTPETETGRSFDY